MAIFLRKKITYPTDNPQEITVNAVDEIVMQIMQVM
jgi:hypothetical protein